MNYTKNHHLPQWVKSDRIRMEDFNQMCLDIEKGLDSASQSQTADAGQLREGIRRIERQLLTARYEQTDVHQSTFGMTLSPLSYSSSAGTLQGAEWDGGVYLGRGSALPDTILRGSGSAFTVAATSLKYEPVEATYTFTAPVSGAVIGFPLRYMIHFSKEHTDFTGGRLTFKAEKKSGSGYTTVYRRTGIPFEKHSTEAHIVTGSDPVEVHVPIVKGESYRFTLRLDAGEGLYARIGFCTWLPSSGETWTDAVDDSTFTVVSGSAASGSHTHHILVGEEASHAIALVRYRGERTNANVSVSLDGKAFTHSSIEELVTESDGQSCRQVWFTCEGSFPRDGDLKIDFSCGEAGNMRLLGYGVIFN